MIDCLLIGHNDSDFTSYIEMVKSMGINEGAYRDLNLAFVEHNQKNYRCLDIMNLFQDQYQQNYPIPNAPLLSPTILYLASYLEKNGHTYDYIKFFNTDKEKLKEKLLKNNIRTIAITTTLYVSPYPIFEIISFIKQYNETAKIIIGGPYIMNQAHLLDENSLKDFFYYFEADFYVISSEGEYTLSKILDALKTEADFDSIQNIAYKKNNDFLMTSRFSEINTLEDNPIKYNLFQADEYGQFLSLRTSKSCPFSCAFCSFPSRAGKYEFLSSEQVELELDRIKEISSITHLTFIDDSFNVPTKRFKDILNRMIKKNYNFKWNCYLRCTHIDEECVELMHKSGCEGVFLGIESGSDTILKNMNKKAAREKYVKAIKLLKQAGILIHANLIVGFPGETEKTFQESFDLIEETGPDFYRGQLWYADPTTPIWEQCNEYGIKGSAFNWQHNTMNSETASDLVDKLFLDIKNSIWMPQLGFELWSVFYLNAAKGMSFDLIKEYIKLFNDGVKEKLRNPQKTDISLKTFNNLKTICSKNQLCKL